VTRPVAPMGDYALRVSLPDLDAVLCLYGALLRRPLTGQVDLVPGAESLVIQLHLPSGPDRVREAERRVAQSRAPAGAADDLDTAPPEVTIDTIYRGADLDEVAELAGLSVEGVVAAHTASMWRVAFCGFAPGFAYLAGGDPRLRVPRRGTPRVDVPSGAVGLADGYSGVYPRSSPGGWQLIGRTDTVLWDPRQGTPALLRPGASVRFRAVRPSVTLSESAAHQQVPSGAPDTATRRAGRAARTLTVLRPGVQCLIQDLGRAGYAEMGVSRSGAADRAALRSANRVVGNPEGAAGLEIVLGGAEFAASGSLLVALAGAPVAVSIAPPASAEDESPAGKPAYHEVATPMQRPLSLEAGARIRLGRPALGLRTYLAVRGGIDVPPMLGSRSTDLLAGLGPAPVSAGQVLPIGPWQPTAAGGSGASEVSRVEEQDSGAYTRHDADTDRMPRRGAGAPSSEDGPRSGSGRPSASLSLAISPGPQRDWFTDDTWQTLRTASWVVSSASNRVAARLTGPEPTRTTLAELPSQGLVRGAIQVPPSGELVAFLADHPVTGGYPVIAVLTDDAADRLAQCRPGTTVRFHDVVTPGT